ncbi:MAG: heavy-metal-associated domain-containing protein [Mariniphaga sp.]
MKRLTFIIIILLAGGITSQSFAQKKGRAVVCYQSDMDCGACEKELYEFLRFEKGVKELKVDHVSNTILVEYIEKKNDEKGLAGAIEKKGYKAEKIDQKKYEQLLSAAKESGHNHQGEVHKSRE